MNKYIYFKKYLLFKIIKMNIALYDNGNIKMHGTKKKSKKELILHTISSETKQENNVHTNNYINPKYLPINNIKNTFVDNKIFKNIKYYAVKKPSKAKKRNISSKQNHKKNSSFSVAESNSTLKKSFIKKNTNSNYSKSKSLGNKQKNSHNHNINQNNINNINMNKNSNNQNNINYNNFIINNNNQNVNNNINMNNNNLNTNSNYNSLINTSTSFKSLSKSKSENAFLTPLQCYLRSRNKSVSSNNNYPNSIMATTSGTVKGTNQSINLNLNSSSCSKKNISKLKCFQTANPPMQPFAYNKMGSVVQRNGKYSDTIPKKNSDEKMKIKKLLLIKEKNEKDIMVKNEIIKRQEERIKEFKSNLDKTVLELNEYKNKYNNLQDEYKKLKDDYTKLLEEMNNKEKNICFMKQKELKLMQILYVVKEKGIDINSILNEINNNKEENHSIYISDTSNRQEGENISNENDDNNNSELSKITAYFPDKVKMNNIMETNCAKIVPNINFNELPEYSFESGQSGNNNEIDDDGLKFNKININDLNFHNMKQNSV